jgi:hypothetical protein
MMVSIAPRWMSHGPMLVLSDLREVLKWDHLLNVPQNDCVIWLHECAKWSQEGVK